MYEYCDDALLSLTSFSFHLVRILTSGLALTVNDKRFVIDNLPFGTGPLERQASFVNPTIIWGRQSRSMPPYGWLGSKGAFHINRTYHAFMLSDRDIPLDAKNRASLNVQCQQTKATGDGASQQYDEDTPSFPVAVPASKGVATHGRQEASSTRSRVGLIFIRHILVSVVDAIVLRYGVPCICSKGAFTSTTLHQLLRNLQSEQPAHTTGFPTAKPFPEFFPRSPLSLRYV